MSSLDCIYEEDVRESGFIHHLNLGLYSPLLDIGRCFSFLIFYAVGRTPWTGDQPFARPLPAHGTAEARNKRTQTSMP
jgi:hypothetical protein